MKIESCGCDLGHGRLFNITDSYYFRVVASLLCWMLSARQDFRRLGDPQCRARDWGNGAIAANFSNVLSYVNN
jgi:hypothetical protein